MGWEMEYFCGGGEGSGEILHYIIYERARVRNESGFFLENKREKRKKCGKVKKN